MGKSQDLSLGKLGMAAGWVTPQQLNECIEIQKRLEIPKPLGLILMERGILNSKQLDALLIKVQEEQALQDTQFAQVAQALGMLELQEIQAAQQQQSLEPDKSLSGIVVELGYLTPTQVDTIFDYFNISKTLTCPHCKRQYNITPYEEGRTYFCPPCAETLVEMETYPSHPQTVPSPEIEGQNSASFQDMGGQEISSPFGSQQISSPPSELPSISPPSNAQQISTQQTPTRRATTSTTPGGPPTSRTATGSIPVTIKLSGAAKGLDIRVPEESEDELCGKQFGDYIIKKKIGAGAMGVVYKAEQIRLRRIVALKMLSEDLCKNEFYIKRFTIEALSAAKLNHPNVLQIYDAGACLGRVFFSMEFVQGESISNVIIRMGKIPLNNAMPIIYQITQALDEAHDHGVVHRDIKPENIMLTVSGIAKLADLGLAKNTDYTKEIEDMESGLVLGTPYYISPEQIDSSLTVDSRADIYSLGVTFYRMITGVIPFFDKDPRAIMKKVKEMLLPPPSELEPSVTPALDYLIGKMIKKKPEERYQTPQELLAALDEVKEKSATQETKKAPSLLREGKMMKIEVKGDIDTSNLDFQEKEEDVAPVRRSSPSPVPNIPGTHPVQSRQISVPSPGIAMPLSPNARVRSHKRKKQSQLPYIIAGIVVVIILAWIFIFKSDKPKNIKTGPNNQPVVKTETEEEKRKKEFDNLMASINEVLEKEKVEKYEELKDSCDIFIRKYTGTSECQEITKRRTVIEDKIDLNNQKKTYEENDKTIRDLLKEKNFARALEKAESALLNNKMAPFKEDIQKLVDYVKKEAGDALNNALDTAKSLSDKERFDEAREFLANSQERQTTKNVERLKTEIKLIDEAKKRSDTVQFQMKIEKEIGQYIEPLMPDKQDYIKAVDKLSILRGGKGISADKKLIIDQYEAEVYQIEILDNLSSSVLDKEWKRQDREYFFKGIPLFTGKSIMVSGKRVFITDSATRKSQNYPLEDLMWSTKRKIFSERKNTDLPETRLLLALYCVIKGMFKEAKNEMEDVSSDSIKPIEERMARAKIREVEKFISQREIKAIINSLKELKEENRDSLDSMKYCSKKLAIELFKLGNDIKNKEILKSIIEYFPETEEAQKAAKKLEEIK